MATGDAFAIAAHLHVLLRRKTGRVTDTEWMATNADYAHEIVRHAREAAASDGHADLLPWADKLEAAIGQMGMRPRVPLLQAAAASLQATSANRAVAPPPAPAARTGGFAHSRQTRDSGFTESTLDPATGQPRREGESPPVDGRYIGGLR